MKNSFIRTALFALLLVAFQDLSYSNGDGDCEFVESFNDAADLQLPPQYNIKWMASIDDQKKISQITIPGTHDTMALHGAWLGAKCQAWSLKDQLEAGIRYLDLRVRLQGDKSLKLVHGPVSQKAKLPEVLGIIKTFLKNYNTETVFVRVKPENVKEKHRLGVKEGVQKLLEEDPDIHAWVESSIPTLRDVRGKMVFIQKKEFDLGIEITGTDEKGDHKVTNLQNKCQLVEGHLKEAKEKCGEMRRRDNTHEEIILTYSSGTGCFCGRPNYKPKAVAKFMNPCLHDYLTYNSEDTSCFGVIAMDFPSFDLIQKVIDVNKPDQQTTVVL